MARADMVVHALADKLVHVMERDRAALCEHGQELCHDARHDHRVVGGAVVVEARQTQPVRHDVELVLRQIRQQVLAEHQRIEKHRIERDAVTQAGIGHEARVKARVVGDERRVAGKVQKHAHGRRLVGRALDVAVADAGQTRDLRRDGHAGVDEGVELLQDLAAAEADRADLRHAAGAEMEARGLDVEGDVLLVEREVVARAAGGKHAVHVVDEIALHAVDDLDAVLLRGLPHIGERLRAAVVGHGDGRVAPLGGALDEIAGVGQRVHGGKAGVQVQLHALVRGSVLPDDGPGLDDAARFEHHVVDVAVKVDRALHLHVHAGADLMDDGLVIVAAQELRDVHGAGVVRHLKAQHRGAALGKLAAVGQKDAALDRHAAGLERELRHGRDRRVRSDRAAHEDALLGLGGLLRLGCGMVRLDLHAAQPVLRGEVLLQLREIRRGGHGREPHLRRHGHRLADDLHLAHLGEPQPAAEVLQRLAAGEHF